MIPLKGGVEVAGKPRGQRSYKNLKSLHVEATSTSEAYKAPVECVFTESSVPYLLRGPAKATHCGENLRIQHKTTP